MSAFWDDLNEDLRDDDAYALFLEAWDLIDNLDGIANATSGDGKP